MTRPLLPLKAGAIIFTLLWTAWMMWWGGSFSSASVVILALCGAAVGYLWYRAMRWQFERMGMLPLVRMIPQGLPDPGSCPGRSASSAVRRRAGTRNRERISC
ncbi:hypothetical protein [Bradyrhizobium diazoefficiens]